MVAPSSLDNQHDSQLVESDERQLKRLLKDYKDGHLNEEILEQAIHNIAIYHATEKADKAEENALSWQLVFGGIFAGFLVVLATSPGRQIVISAAHQVSSGVNSAASSMSGELPKATSAYEGLAKAFEGRVDSSFTPSYPGPYCAYFMWDVLNSVGWDLSPGREPLDPAIRGQYLSKGLAASFGADLAVGGINRDASRAKRGQVVLFTGTYAGSPNKISHVGFVVEDATPGKAAVMVDKGSSPIIQKRPITAVGGEFVASFFLKVPPSIAVKYGQK